MSNTQAPLGPGHNNITNYDGSPLSYFQRSDQTLISEAIQIVYAGLAGLQVAHEPTLSKFTEQLNNCSFFVQGYDNSKFVCFGAIRILTNDDLLLLNQYYGGFGANPYGTSGYGGGFSYNGLFGEICYIYQNPTYAGDLLGNEVINLLINSQRDFVNPAPSRKLFCIIPTTIPTGQQYDYMRYLTGTDILATGVTVGSKGVASTGSVPYHGITAASAVMSTFIQ